MAAQLVDKLSEGSDWLYELKFDGYRALLIKDGAEVRVVSRNQEDLTRTYPTVVVAVQRLAARHAVIDGEIVAQGQPSFQAPQHARHRAGCKPLILLVAGAGLAMFAEAASVPQSVRVK